VAASASPSASIVSRACEEDLARRDVRLEALGQRIAERERRLEAIRDRSRRARDAALESAEKDDAVDTYNGLVDEYNRLVTEYNRALRRQNALLRRADVGRERYRDAVNRCLAEREATWESAAAAIESRLGDEASGLAGVPTKVECHPASVWARIERESRNSRYELGGYVEDGEATIHLAPGVCRALDVLVRDGPGGLRCLRTTLRLGAPVCPPRVFVLADAIETLAHEASHVAGVEDEAVATCNGIQWTVGLAGQLGIAEAAARRLARAQLRFVDRPPEYRSRECRRGGALDLEPETPAWP
jgi:hypothetical protein